MKEEALAFIAEAMRHGGGMLYTEQETGLAARLYVVEGSLAQMGAACGLAGGALATKAFIPGIDADEAGIDTIAISSDLAEFLSPDEIIAAVVHENAHFVNGDLVRFAEEAKAGLVDNQEAELAADAAVIAVGMAKAGYSGLLKIVHRALAGHPKAPAELAGMSDQQFEDWARSTPKLADFTARLDQFKQHF